MSSDISLSRVSSSITFEGIEQAVSNLKYSNPNILKYKYLHAVMRRYSSQEDVDRLRTIDQDSLIREIWNLGDDPQAVRAKRKNLNSIRSTVNADLKKLYEKGENPEGITIDSEHVFNMSEQAKSDKLQAFSHSVQSDDQINLDAVSDVLNMINDFISKHEGLEHGESTDNALEKIKDILGELEGLDLTKDSEAMKEIDDDEVDIEEVDDVEFEDVDEDEVDILDEDDEIDEIDDLDEDDLEEVDDEDVDIIIDDEEEEEEEDIEDVEDDELEDIDDEDVDIVDDEDVEEVEDDELEDIDDEDVDIIDDEDIEEVEDDELEDIDDEGVDIIDDEDIEEVEDDELEDIDDEDVDIIDDEDIEEVEEGELEGIDDEDVDIVDDEDIEEVEEGELEGIDDEDVDIVDDENDELEEVDDEDVDIVDGEDIEDIDDEDVDIVADDDIEDIDDDDVDILDDEDLEEIDDDDVDIIDEDDLEEIEEAPGADGSLESGIPDEGDGPLLSENEKNRMLAEQFVKHLGTIDRYYSSYLSIPEGYFTIGSPDPKRHEIREHSEWLKGFYMGKFPITNSLFEVFVNKTGYRTTAERVGHGIVYSGRYKKKVDKKTGQIRSVWKTSHSYDVVKGACWYQPEGPESSIAHKLHHPVVQVSQEDALAFASWIGKSLPTEIQWEAAARTARGYTYPWGNEWFLHACNMEDSAVSDTTPVDQYLDFMNEYHVADLLGNVLEWTADTIPSPYNKKAGDSHVIAKGGSFISQGPVPLWARFIFKDGYTSNIVGFRCAVR